MRPGSGQQGLGTGSLSLEAMERGVGGLGQTTDIC